MHTRSSLGLIGLLLAALAMVAGYGLAMAMKLPFTSLQQVTSSGGTGCLLGAAAAFILESSISLCMSYISTYVAHALIATPAHPTDTPMYALLQTLPFVLLGVAVDVMFILVKAYEELEADPMAPYMSLPDIFERLLAGAGVSVLVTSLASMVAFALGTLVPMNSITWFSAYAVLSVLCICIMQVRLLGLLYYSAF